MMRYPDREWVKPRFAPDGQPILDALIIGAGQCGLAVGYALKRDQINNIRLIDAACTPDRQGPWKTFARMETLRSPKHFTGPDLGTASLTFESWSVSVLVRNHELKRVNPHKWTEFSGFLNHFRHIPDDAKWAIMHWFNDNGHPIKPH